jgi:hypothetical protein
VKKLDLKGRSKQFKDFYAFADEYRKKHGGVFDFRNSKRVRVQSASCCGFFEEDGKKIVSAALNPLFEQIFIHEFCHFQQYTKEAPAYTECDDKFWWDMEKKKIGIDAWDSTLSIIAMERDCEMRSIQMSKKFGGLFNEERYAQRANCYFYFYHYCFLVDSWSGTHKLYDSHLQKLMPTKILPMKTFQNIDMELMKEYCGVFGLK